MHNDNKAPHNVGQTVHLGSYYDDYVRSNF